MADDAGLVVGARSRSARHVAEARDATAYPAELSVLLRMLDEVRPSGGAELVSLRWDRRPPPDSPDGGAGLRLEATVTRRVPGEERATIHQSVRVLDDHDRERCRSTVAWSAPVELSRSEAAAWKDADFASVRWGERLRDRLAADPRFAAATRSFDGAIAFAVPDRQVHFRIYRGTVIDVARKSLDGATFAVEGADLAWVELLGAASNDFIRRTSDGHFRVQGSGYQYLRMIKAVMIMIDQARALTRDPAVDTSLEATGA
ncbi:hypothetical protein ACFOY4_03145 [Actinomadura syzygii]|uniref:SCP2 domain-containing protein n=1 Tax=Actinomadura syzygii TaxID=1427538 RepID=A0A5D0UGS5_9ACTN|nr:hypothetical protein [Actinomadura syzygii]TYC17598.1 hypothetical protein FXF65_06315 [Actinomadura syzygii]